MGGSYIVTLLNKNTIFDIICAVGCMLEKEFLDFGYSRKDYEFIKNSHPINEYTDEALLKKFKQITQLLLYIGYSDEDIIKMTITFPAIYSYSVENMKQKLDDIMSLGYNRQEVIKMTKVFPAIYALSMENMKQKINDIISLSYSKEEVVKITKLLPTIYGLSIENIKQKINDIMSLGYSREEAMKMTIYLPTIYGLSIKNIKQKIEFYDSIDMHQLAVVDPKQLMQSVTLSYARYQFYLSRGINVDMDCYQKLFMSNNKFIKKYGIEKEELLKLYNYEQFLEERKNERII